jgi:DNA-binding LacI/PurR family transcriptional regulator
VGLKNLARALVAGVEGVFCCNDRLAQAVLAFAADIGLLRPRVVGFDNAPVAERLNLTTIAIPWGEMVAEIAGRRLAGDASTTRQVIVTPRPIVRAL